MKEHTPEPWTYYASTVDSNKRPESWTVYQFEDPCRSICSIEFSSGIDEEDEANARFIVHAANSHEDLLEAAKIGLSVLESEEGTDKTEGDKVRAAIAKAEEKS